VCWFGPGAANETVTSADVTDQEVEQFAKMAEAVRGHGMKVERLRQSPNEQRALGMCSKC
jgi:hypothetical protein